MGQLKGDGRATNVTFGAGTIDFGELYRQDGWNGIAMKDIASGDTDRDAAMEISSERIWYVDIGAGPTGAKGDLLYWTTGQAEPYLGASELQDVANGEPCAIVEEAVDGNNIAGIRVLNLGKPAT